MSVMDKRRVVILLFSTMMITVFLNFWNLDIFGKFLTIPSQTLENNSEWSDVRDISKQYTMIKVAKNHTTISLGM